MNNLMYNNKIYEIYKLSTKILEETFGKNYSFPIDIYKIAEKLNVNIIETQNPTWNKCKAFKTDEYYKQRIDKENFKPLNAILTTHRNYLTKTTETIIIVNQDITYDYQRYSIAYLIAKFLLCNSDEKDTLLNGQSFDYYYQPLEIGDTNIETLAYFLIAPPHIILSELEQQKLTNNYRADEDTTIHKFETNLYIPLVHTVIAIDRAKNLYEYIKDNNLENDIDEKIEEVYNNLNQNQDLKSQKVKNLTK